MRASPVQPPFKVMSGKSRRFITNGGWFARYLLGPHSPNGPTQAEKLDDLAQALSRHGGRSLCYLLPASSVLGPLFAC